MFLCILFSDFHRNESLHDGTEARVCVNKRNEYSASQLEMFNLLQVYLCHEMFQKVTFRLETDLRISESMGKKNRDWVT